MGACFLAHLGVEAYQGYICTYTTVTTQITTVPQKVIGLACTCVYIMHNIHDLY